MVKKLIFASDHAGFNLRSHLARYAESKGIEVLEVGASGQDPYDYPLAADVLVPRILTGEFELGVLVCGSGIGVSIRANRYPGIRAAECWNEQVARLARNHNHANVLCMGERLISAETGEGILDAFLDEQPAEEDRHRRRVSMLG